MTDKPYRQGVGIVLINRQGLVFVGKRIDTRSEAWQLPQGGIDSGEEPHMAALRELEEETGVPGAAVRVIGQTDDWLTYDLPEHLASTVWKGKYRGQRQLWYALALESDDDSLIDIAHEPEHAEFSEYQWVELKAIPDLIVPFKKNLYTDLVRYFTPIVNDYVKQ